MSVSQVIKLLRENPGKISPENRAEMRRLLEFDEGDVIDLQGRNMEKVRAENRKMRRNIGQLYRAGRDNERLLDFLHAFALAALRAPSPKALARKAHRNAKALGISDGFALVPEADLGDLACSTRLWKKLRSEGFSVGGLIPMEFKPCLGRSASRIRSHVMIRVGTSPPWLAAFFSYSPGEFRREGADDFIDKFSGLAKAGLGAIAGRIRTGTAKR